MFSHSVIFDFEPEVKKFAALLNNKTEACQPAVIRTLRGIDRTAGCGQPASPPEVGPLAIPWSQWRFGWVVNGYQRNDERHYRLFF